MIMSLEGKPLRGLDTLGSLTLLEAVVWEAPVGTGVGHLISVK
jgi:hypothetical protein